MRAWWVLIGLVAAAGGCLAQNTTMEDAAREDPGRLVREVVYNEQHDHAQHGYFQYWVERRTSGGTTLEEQVETAAGPVTRLLQQNGQPVTGQVAAQEEARLELLRDSAAEQAKRRAAYQQDEGRVATILVLLPDAFLYQDEGVADGVRRLHFSPNPNYSAHGVEARVFHGMSGDLWIDLRAKRMRRLEGRVTEAVDFGFGLLGSVEKGSWFRMVRTEASATDWKTEQLEVHMKGHALLFKTIARNTSETRGGFAEVPARMSLMQGIDLLETSDARREAAARIAPARIGFRQ